MAQQMKLFLIRHGETVDNVAQVYAGSRDSALTNHGYQQATRLGLHLSSLGLSFTHLFSSPLQRAAKTAGLIREAQLTPASDGSPRTAPDIVQLPVLMEQDFGFYEGKKWYERPVDGKSSGKEYHRQSHKDTEGFVDIESKESLARRADAFLNRYLLPLLHSSEQPTDLEVAVVSHGIMLSTLWKRLLARLPERSVDLSPELAATTLVSLEHLGAWSNTGYLEVHLLRIALPRPTSLTTIPAIASTATALESDVASSTPAPVSGIQATSEEHAGTSLQIPAPITEAVPLKLGPDWSLTIHTINGKDHLKGLKRTGGGVGSSRYDASQKNIDSFFKRRKVD
ncbi:hypothetical protein N0V90_005558 [Kalmusia sp. IMI 367209]|nr:hypothetical protein N0V90_005558 [Kalmusia sp. IMI 367209]